MRTITNLVLFFLIGINSEAFAQTDREIELHDIYQSYHSKPTDPATWSRLTEPLQTESYKIQSGDNLWVISEIFFGDGNYWPKVWSVNSRIENPHLIEPGNEIRFRLGTSESEPSFFVTEQNASASELEIQSVAAETSGNVAIEAPPPMTPPKPVLKELPPSFPSWNATSQTSGSDFDEWGLEIVPRPSLVLSNQKYLQSLVVEGPVPFVGEVMEAQVDDQLMVEGKIIFVRLRENGGQVGDKFLIVNDSGPLAYETEVDGHVLRVAGQVTLKEPLEVKDPDIGYSYFRAHIDKSLDLTTRGLKLISGSLKKIDFSKPGRVSETPIQIVGGQFDNRGFHFAAGSIVYLDKGSLSGVAEGDIFLIQKTKRKRFLEPDPLIDQTRVQAGQVQVVDVRDRFATAVVLEGSKTIHPGDGSFQ